MRFKDGNLIYRTALILMTAFTVSAFWAPVEAFAASAAVKGAADVDPGYDSSLIGGGYAATGQLENVGYSTVIYDAANGLPTSDANYVLSTSDGYILIAGYSGIMRYDGSVFTRLDVPGLTNGRGMFEDSRGRIWVGTNDNGVVVLDGNESTHITYKEGLPSSSIRVFAEDNEGNVYIGTTAGVCYADPEMQIHIIDHERLNDERVLKLDSDKEGTIYGQTKNGLVFRILDHRVSGIYSNDELDMAKISTIMVDPEHDNKLYLCTENDVVYYGEFGNLAEHMEHLSTAPLTGAHWISYECGRVWISSISGTGYFDEDSKFRVITDIPLNSGIEMMTSDFQGNMWFASSTQGVMKLVANSFVDINSKAGLPREVVNASCIYDGLLYVGTESGLHIIDNNYNDLEFPIVKLLRDTRIRCIKEGKNGELWIGTFNNGKGLIRLSKDGSIFSFTTGDGMPDNAVRCIDVQKDGSILVGTDGGLAVIKGDKVVRKFGAKDGVKNTVFLTVAEGKNNDIFVGTDGDGIYLLQENGLTRIGRDDGLLSDVVRRIIRDDVRDMYWVVTSNSIEYLKNGALKQVTTFPYNNNYDMYVEDNKDIWVVSSCGVFVVDADEMVKDKISDYRLYKVENGLAGTPTSNSYSDYDNGYLFVSGRNGVCMVNTGHLMEEEIPVRAEISSVYFGDEQIFPDENGVYRLPSTDERISITASVLDYTLSNPQVSVYMEGRENEGITVLRSGLKPIEFTGLDFGNYVLHIKVLSGSGNILLYDKSFKIEKKAKLNEIPLFRLFVILLFATFGGIIVWRVLKSTVISKQYAEIRAAKDEAERANSAKTRFLANMSHEIRTPINTIMGMNEMALREDATGVPKGYFMSMMNYSFDIRNASESLLSLINDILDMSKIESGKMNLVEQEYDSQEMLRSVVSMIRMKSTQKELVFDVVIDELLPVRLFGDAGKIKQIVLNLLSNALKYTAVGGFALCVSMDEREDDVCKLRFSVKDTGIGIKEEDMDKLFTAYERLDEKQNSGIQGTGLGLDISRRFALLLGGDLTCESVYGEGSEFIFTVSQKIVDRTPIGIFKEHDESAASGPYVPQFIAPDADILVVDDTPMNLNVIKGLLKATRVFVTTATSGEECLEKIKETRFNIVLLDHMMPGMDGVETVEKIRETDPDLPVYALTANAALGEAFYKSKGFNGYLAKPVDSLTLEKTIMKHLPEEMMKKPGKEDAVEEVTQMPDELKWIYDTEGIKAEEGIANSGGISNYIFSLNMFLDTIDENARVIRDAYENGNIRLYTIKVHSLKSSARIIGAAGLSEKAAVLEDAGNRNDKAFINVNNEELLSDYLAFKEKLSGLKDKGGSEDKEMIPEEELKSAYEALSDVIPQMDYDSVEMILEQLDGYALPKEDEIRIKELAKMLDAFDWDGMEALIKQ
ncbi:MAG: response regulator [Lachnospiraceae bacterium]|nr:response regulator [Lachnospiraceae bacterium]